MESQDLHSEELPALANADGSHQDAASIPPLVSEAPAPARPATSSDLARPPPSPLFVPAPSGPTVNSYIERLLEEQKRARAEKRRVSEELTHAQRRRRRLKHKARLLSQDDLVHILALRQEDREAPHRSSETELTARADSAAPPRRCGPGRPRAHSRSRSRSPQTSPGGASANGGTVIAAELPAGG